MTTKQETLEQRLNALALRLERKKSFPKKRRVAALLREAAEHVWRSGKNNRRVGEMASQIDSLSEANKDLAAAYERASETIDELRTGVESPDAEVCPHGEPAGECDACDQIADQAFDAARECSYFGRSTGRD